MLPPLPPAVPVLLGAVPVFCGAFPSAIQLDRGKCAHGASAKTVLILLVSLAHSSSSSLLCMQSPGRTRSIGPCRDRVILLVFIPEYFDFWFRYQSHCIILAHMMHVFLLLCAKS